MDGTSKRAKTIFLDAVEKCPPDRWESFLVEECGDDFNLRHRVNLLLQAHQGCDSLLDSPAPTDASDLLWTNLPGPPPEGPGTVIGPFKLVEQIGEGGMGVVYLAEQTIPVRRTVALKIIKPGMDTKLVIARFEAERQALALMDHPNIARVLDAGTTDTGRPYFVMELVKGVPITAYCDMAHLTLKERIELFVPVCQAIQHAHQKGIIHRDIKPSNVMITTVDPGAPGVPKVIDFGVAKAIDQRLTERTVCTQQGVIVGTLEYMSPEQAELSGLDIDTRSDIYALGALLYELLTGSTPLGRASLKQNAYTEILRRIKEVEAPKPSIRLSHAGDRVGALAARRRADPAKLAKQVRGDLDLIVMKCLEKDRARRYATANGVARDLMRYLADKPVEASPPSRWSRFSKLARRNRALLTTTLLFSIALIAGSALSIWQAIRATRAEHLAKDALALADENRRLAERHLYAFSLRQSNHAIEQGQLERAQEMLESVRSDLGGPAPADFAWRYLNHLAFRQIAPFVKQQTMVVRIALSPDGRTLASADTQGAIVLTDTASGCLRGRLDGHTAPVKLLAFSSNGNRLVSVTEVPRPSGREEAWIWDIETGCRLAELDTSRPGYVLDVVFSASGSKLVTAVQTGQGDPATLQLFDIAREHVKPVLIRSLQVHADRHFALSPNYLAAQPLAHSLTVLDTETFQPRWSALARDSGQARPVFSADGRRLATEDGHCVVIWDAATGRELNRSPVERPGHEIASLVMSPNGERLLIHYKPLRVSVLDLAADPPTPPRNLPLESPEQYFLQQAEFSRDGSRLALVTMHSGGGDGPLSIWETCSGRLLATYPRRPQVVFTRGGESLLMSAENRVLRWWFQRTSQGSPQSLAGHLDEAWAVAFSPDGRILATGSDDTEDDDTLKLWSVESGRLIKGWRPHPGTVSSLAFSPDGRTLASAALCPEQNLRIWDVATGQLRATLEGHTDRVRSVAFSPDGRRIASAGTDRVIRIWDGKTGRALAELVKHTDAVRKVVFSPDCRTLASASNDQTVLLWDLSTGKVKREFRTLKKVSVVRISPDGSLIAAADEGGDIVIWKLGTGELRATMRGDQVRLLALTFSPEGRILATAGISGVIKLWDVQSRQEILTLKGHNAQINGLSFSPDGRTLASCSHDGNVKLWRSEEEGCTSQDPQTPEQVASHPR
jgi:WD40 repeat protein/serine/threonine protein kinase